MFYIPSLNNFFIRHGITLKHCEDIIRNSEIISAPKGVCLYRQNEVPDSCYILIKGELSVKFLNIDDNMNPLVIDQHLCGQIAKEYNLSHDINIKAFNRKFNNLNRERNYDHSNLTINQFVAMINQGEEIFEISNTCKMISDYNMLNKINHKTSCYTKSECLLLCLDRKAFTNSIEEPLSVYESNIKLFILNHINVFHKQPSKLFNLYYDKISIEYPHLNEEVIKKGDAENFYLIYKGSCIANLFKHIKYDAGSFIGLEALEDDNKYKYSIRVSESNTILLKFNVNSFVKSFQIYEGLKKELLPLLEKQKAISEEFDKKVKNIVKIFKLKQKDSKTIEGCKKIFLRRDIKKEESKNTVKTSSQYISNSTRNLFLNKSTSNERMLYKVSKHTPHIPLSTRNIFTGINNTSNFPSTRTNSKLALKIKRTPHNKNKILNRTFFTNVNSQCSPLTERPSQIRNLILGKKKCISLRKNLAPLFIRSRNYVNTRTTTSTLSNKTDRNRTVLFYETQNYNIPLAHVLATDN